MLFDLKVINSVLGQLEEERGIPREKIIEAIAAALATAYKKEFGKKGQMIRATFNPDTGATEFFQVKLVVDDSRVIDVPEDEEMPELPEGDIRVRYNPEHHIMIDDARLIKRDAQLDEELSFPLEPKEDFGRIAAQTAKQVIIQKIREAEKITVLGEYGKREGDIVTGTVERVERGTIFLNMGRAIGVLPFEEQIRTEHYRQGERVRAYLFRVEESPRGVFLKLSRSHPQFLAKLFEIEAPEIANKTVEVKAVAREAGSRSKIAVMSHDSHIDPVGSLVGQRGVRVNTVTAELGGEKVDIIEWSEDPKKFIEEALSPAKISKITLDETAKTATVEVAEAEQSLAIGKGGQNVRLAAKLTGWKIDIRPIGGSTEAAAAEAPASTDSAE
jgi:N utilization substance protein A